MVQLIKADIDKDTNQTNTFLMGKMLEKKQKHTEFAHALKDGEECKYLFIFSVYHLWKPEQNRVVFDLSTK